MGAETGTPPVGKLGACGSPEKSMNPSGRKPALQKRLPFWPNPAIETKVSNNKARWRFKVPLQTAFCVQSPATEDRNAGRPGGTERLRLALR